MGLGLSRDERKWLNLDLHIIQQARPRYHENRPVPLMGRPFSCAYLRTTYGTPQSELYVALKDSEYPRLLPYSDRCFVRQIS